MKKLLFSIIFIATFFVAKAQSGTGTIDATPLVTITGGDGTGTVVSALWSIQGTPPGTVVLSAANNLKTNVTVTAIGTYNLLLTVKDNLGNTATGVFIVNAYFSQGINIKVTVTQIIIK